MANPEIPDVSLYVYLHLQQDLIEVFSDAEGRWPLSVLRLKRGQGIGVVFINPTGGLVETGDVALKACDPSRNPFPLPSNPVNTVDNGMGAGRSPVRGNCPPVRIRGDAPIGAEFQFNVCGTWDNRTHRYAEDPTIVIDP